VLIYRGPREPSSPRIAIWRMLRSLGVAQLARTVARLRKELRTIRRRDHFPPIERDEAVAAIDRLAEPATTPHESVAWSRT
jgi:hypothetical protein